MARVGRSAGKRPPSARINDNGPEAYRGLDRFEARRHIVGDLEEQGLLEETRPHKLTVPRRDRSHAAEVLLFLFVYFDTESYCLWRVESRVWGVTLYSLHPTPYNFFILTNTVSVGENNGRFCTQPTR